MRTRILAAGRSTAASSVTERGENVLIDPADGRYADTVGVGAAGDSLRSTGEVSDALQGCVLGRRHPPQADPAVPGGDDVLQRRAAAPEQAAGQPVPADLQPLFTSGTFPSGRPPKCGSRPDLGPLRLRPEELGVIFRTGGESLFRPFSVPPARRIGEVEKLVEPNFQFRRMGKLQVEPAARRIARLHCVEERLRPERTAGPKLRLTGPQVRGGADDVQPRSTLREEVLGTQNEDVHAVPDAGDQPQEEPEIFPAPTGHESDDIFQQEQRRALFSKPTQHVGESKYGRRRSAGETGPSSSLRSVRTWKSSRQEPEAACCGESVGDFRGCPSRLRRADVRPTGLRIRQLSSGRYRGRRRISSRPAPIQPETSLRRRRVRQRSPVRTERTARRRAVRRTSARPPLDNTDSCPTVSSAEAAGRFFERTGFCHGRRRGVPRVLWRTRGRRAGGHC